ncbi:hypothetical protein FS749_009354 [Ceratobasidium sp. UAMH 11750]|nr:hypothetical protein FS749_009354 [Ceratobasidium sp. UAMH 11750]
MSRFPSFNAHFSYLPYVNSGNDGMEPVVANAFTKPLRLFCVGPPFDPLPKTPNLTSPNSNDSILSFLNRAYAELGSRSVIYIAFGTISFPLPQSMDHLKIVIAEILAQVFRVVSALSSGGAKAGANAIFPEWMDQFGVLGHPVIHYFLTHGGWDSVTESLVHGVPMIIWSLAGDHSTNTIQLTKRHECGYELFQIRTGAAKSIRSVNYQIAASSKGSEAAREEIRAMLDATRGARGVQQRLNARALREVVVQSVGKGGGGDRTLGELGRAIGL